MKIKPLTIDDAEYVAHAYVVERMNFENEPMPPFNTREPGKLESCLAEPFATFGGKSLHRTLNERAAVLFYLVIKNHGFSNGNKRMAVVLTNVFFFINKRWLVISNMTLYEIANSVAESSPSQKNTIIFALKTTFKKHSRPLSEL